MKLNPKLLIPGLLVLLMMQGCRKEPEPVTTTTCDTAFPKPYFPAYPGSYWKHLVNGDTVSTIAGPYTIAYERFTPDNHYVRVGVNVSSPLLPGMHLGYARFYKIAAGGSFCNAELQYFSETPGYSFITNATGSSTGCENGCNRTGMNIQYYPQFTVGQNTFSSVCVIEYATDTGCENDWGAHITRSYFAKDVGLIYSVVIDPVQQDTTRYELVDWHINH